MSGQSLLQLFQELDLANKAVADAAKLNDASARQLNEAQSKVRQVIQEIDDEVNEIKRLSYVGANAKT